MFVRNNGVRQIYVPTNGWYTEKTIAASGRSSRARTSIFRGGALARRHPRLPRSFPWRRRDPSSRPMETYDALAELQKNDPRLRIHAISTATGENLDEIRRLTDYLLRALPPDGSSQPRAHPRRSEESVAAGAGVAGSTATLRIRAPAAGRRASTAGSDPSSSRCCSGRRSRPPTSGARSCRAPREAHRRRVRQRRRQRVRKHIRVGNLRENSFRGDLALTAGGGAAARESIAGECHCTNEVFLWPSIAFQPLQLARAWVSSGRTAVASSEAASPAPR